MRQEVDPDPLWVAELSGRSPAVAARAIAEAAADRRLFSALDREHRREGRASYVEIDAPLELHALVRLTRPRHLVEVGVSSGVSSAYLLAALRRNGVGTLHSVDLPQAARRRPYARGGSSWSIPPGRASGWAVPRALRSRWDLRLGDKAGIVPLLADELPRVDLVVYDVPHDDDNVFDEFTALDRRMPRGAVAIVDHGPSGTLCAALRRWARRRGARPVRRAGLGLYGMRARSARATEPGRSRRAGARAA